jgi:hypothetical protein
MLTLSSDFANAAAAACLQDWRCGGAPQGVAGLGVGMRLVQCKRQTHHARGETDTVWPCGLLCGHLWFAFLLMAACNWVLHWTTLRYSACIPFAPALTAPPKPSVFDYWC